MRDVSVQDKVTRARVAEAGVSERGGEAALADRALHGGADLGGGEQGRTAGYTTRSLALLLLNTNLGQLCYN